MKKFMKLFLSLLMSTIFLSSCTHYNKDALIESYRHYTPEAFKKKIQRVMEDQNIEELDALLSSMQDKDDQNKIANYINAKDTRGYTLLHMAAIINNPKMVKLLLDYGADPKVVNNEGETPLQSVEPNIRAVIGAAFGSGMAKYRENDMARAEETCLILLAHGADINAVNKEGRTFIFKIIEQYPQALKLAVEKGANLQVKDAKGRGLLHLDRVLTKGRESILQFLLDQHLDVNVKDSAGETPLFKAIRYNNEKAIELLLQYGADINAKDPKGDTVLHKVCFDRNLRMIKLLIAKGANVNLANHKGSTPLDMVLKDGPESYMHSEDKNQNSLSNQEKDLFGKDLFAPYPKNTIFILYRYWQIAGYLAAHGAQVTPEELHKKIVEARAIAAYFQKEEHWSKEQIQACSKMMDQGFPKNPDMDDTFYNSRRYQPL